MVVEAMSSGTGTSAEGASRPKANIQREKKTAPNSKVAIHCPLPTDILFGRGGESNNHPGNQTYQRFLEERAHEYSELKGRKVKTKFAWNIVMELKEQGARFLVRAAGAREFHEADDEESRKKVSQRIREMALAVREHSEHNNNNNKRPAETSGGVREPKRARLSVEPLNDAASTGTESSASVAHAGRRKVQPSVRPDVPRRVSQLSAQRRPARAVDLPWLNPGPYPPPAYSLPFLLQYPHQPPRDLLLKTGIIDEERPRKDPPGSTEFLS